MVRHIRTRIAIAALGVATTALHVPAAALELSPPLAKTEVAALIVDQKVDFVRHRDGARQAWDFKGSGTVYFTTSTTVRNTSFSGSYTLGDDGVVCFKWNRDKFVQMNDNCVLFRRDGDKLVIAVDRTPDAPFADVVR